MILYVFGVSRGLIQILWKLWKRCFEDLSWALTLATVFVEGGAHIGGAYLRSSSGRISTCPQIYFHKPFDVAEWKFTVTNLQA